MASRVSLDSVIGTWPKRDQSPLVSLAYVWLGKEDLIFFDMNVLTKQYRLGVVRVGVRGHLPPCVERSGLEKQQVAQGSGDG